MSTQSYNPQPNYPPPGARRPPKFGPRVGLPEVIAIAKLPGRLVESNFGPTEVVFDLTDGRPWYVPQCVADDVYRCGIRPRQQFEVLQLGRAKYEVRITPLDAHLGADAAVAAATPAIAPIAQTNTDNTRNDNTPPPTPWPDSTFPHPGPSSRFAGAYREAIEVLLDSRAYAQSKGLALEVRCEDVRCLAATIGGRCAQTSHGRHSRFSLADGQRVYRSGDSAGDA